MAVTKIRGNDVNANTNNSSIADLLAPLGTSMASLATPLVSTKYGALSLGANGQLVFTPGTLAAKLAAGKNATESIKLTVNTDTGPQQIQVTYVVRGQNDDPTAANDALTLSNGKAGKFSVLKNDFDIDSGDKLKVVGLTNTESAVSLVKDTYTTTTKHGTLSVSSSGAVKFVVDARYANLAFTDSVTYQISDGKGGFSTAALDISNNGGTAAARPGRLDLVSADDKGTSNTDNLTSSEKVTVTGFAVANQTVKLFNNDVAIGEATADINGRFSLSDVVLTEGANAITAQSTDPAGVVLSSEPLVITADFTPPAAPTGLALALEDDTGSSDTDGLTSKTSGLTITGNAAPDSVVFIFRDSSSVPLGSGIADSKGAFSIDVSLAAGTYDLIARAQDKAGNPSPVSTALSITVVAPPAASLKPIISSVANDAGTVVPVGSATNDVTPSLTITLAQELPAGATIAVYDGGLFLGTATGSGNSFSFTPERALTEGLHNFSARVIDVAGSLGPLSNVRPIEIDITAPVAPGMLDLATPDDTGRSSTDNITQKTTDLTLTASVLSATRASDVTLYRWDDADGNGLVEQSELTVVSPIGSGATVKDGVYRADVALDSGEHVLLLTQKDLAGNESLPKAGNALKLVIDADVPLAPTDLDLAQADDSGRSDTDNLTKNASALTISGKAEAAGQVELYRLSGNNEISLGKVLASADGTFSIDVNLPEGTSGVYARVTDVAGNISVNSVPLNITVDATAPAAPSAMVLAAADDTGRSDRDAITSKTEELTFTGTTSEGSSVEVFKLDGNTLVSLGQATVTGNTFTIDLALAEGAQRLVAKATDAAGNVSSTSATLAVTVDTTAPTPISTINLADAADTGISSTDNITSKTTGLNITAVVAAGTDKADVSFYEWNDANFNGLIDEPDEITALASTAVANPAVNGTTYAANLTLANGVHKLIATQKDAAGNESIKDAANVFTIVVDNVAPTQVAEIDFAAEANATQALIGGALTAPLNPGDVIQVWNGSVMLGTATVDEDNASWSFVLARSNSVKTLNLTTKVVDLAGNQGAFSNAATVTLGTSGDDVISGVTSDREFIFGFDGNDTIDGGAGNDVIFGGSGNDRLKGGEGNDAIHGGAGSDTIEGENGNDLLTGGDGNDILRGGAGDDNLYGDAGNDRLLGGLGNDFLNGGVGIDTFTGGDGTLNNAGKPVNDGGADTYQILEGDSALPPSSTSQNDVTSLVDQVTDYFKGSDTIDLGGLTVDTLVGSSTSSYSAAFNAAANELQLGADSSYQYLATTSGGGLLSPPVTTEVGIGYLFINADGSLSADQVIQITGVGSGGL